MAKKVDPYVGVTGFMSKNEVEEALKVVPRNSKRRLMVGVLLSDKTLRGERNKWPGRYPKKENISEIFTSYPQVLNLIHYNTDYPDTLSLQLAEITKIADPNFDGFQLNTAWPPIAELWRYRNANPNKFLLLQMGDKALKKIDSYGCLAESYLEDRFTDYSWVIDAVLVDPSGGKGQPLNSAKGAKYLRGLRAYPLLGIGIAGGLGPDSLRLIEPLLREFPNLSIDAEGKLRTPKPEDALNMEATKSYLERAFELLKDR